MGDATPFRLNVQAKHESYPLRMDNIVVHSELFSGHERRDDKNILLE